GGRARRSGRLSLLDLKAGLREQHAGLAGLTHRLRQPMLLDPRPDLEVAVRIEELRGHRDQLRDLAVVVLELEHLGVALEVVEVVDRAQRELALQIVLHDSDLRLVERRAVDELLPLRRELAVVWRREPLQSPALRVAEVADRFA